MSANATAHTDSGPFTALNAYFYRVIAMRGAEDSIASNTASFEASAGFIEFTTRLMTVSKTAGTATIAVTRFGGGIGAATVDYGTSDSTAVAGTHFTNTTGTLSWASGEVGNKVITVPIINAATPQQARQFAIYLWGAGGGAKTGVYTSINVLIEDPTASLPIPWMQTVIGTVDHASPAVEAEGFIGSTVIGGVLSGGSPDGGRFAYQERSGNGSMTAYIRTTTPFDFGARIALVVRQNLTSTAYFAGICSGGADYGTKFIYRVSSYVNQSGGSNSLVTPCWIRMTRAGSLFTGEHSVDGTTWTTISQTTLTSIPDKAYWGIFNCASGISSKLYTASYQLSGVENVSFSGLSEPPTPVEIFTASNQTISINNGANKTSAANFHVGNGFHHDTLAISNGGVLNLPVAGASTGYLYVGTLAGDNFNAITIDGVGSALSTAGGELRFGYRGSDNTLTISNGGTLTGGSWGNSIGGFGSAARNSITVTGAGSTWNTQSNINLNAGGSNSISVLAGGLIINGPAGNLNIGNASGSNTVTVSGSGSLFTQKGGINIGSTNGLYHGNALIIGGGGTINVSDSGNTGLGIVINGLSGATGNKVQLDGGTLTVQSAGSSTPAIDVKKGALIMNSGTVSTERLLANTDATSVVTFNGGTLSTQGTTLANGSLFTVGNGTRAAGPGSERWHPLVRQWPRLGE